MDNDEISEIKGVLKRYNESLPKFTILLLGPGQHSSEEYNKKCYDKRLKLKSALKEDNNKVLFSEDISEIAKQENDPILNMIEFEEYLLKDEADMVIFIFVLNAPGLQGELDAFSQLKQYATKICVYHDTTYYKRGDRTHWQIDDVLNKIEGNGGRVYQFTEEDINSCSLATEIKKSIKSRRVVVDILPYKKYSGVN